MAKHIKWIALAGVLFVLAYLAVFLQKVDLSLTYYWQQTVPITWQLALQDPGGISFLWGARIIEGMARPVTAYLVMVLLVLLNLGSLRAIFGKLSPGPLCLILMFASFLPLLPLFAHYDLPVHLYISVIAALFLAMLQGFYLPRNRYLGILYHFFLGGILFFISGSVGLLMLAQVLVVRALIRREYFILISLVPLALLPLLFLWVDGTYTLETVYLNTFMVSSYMKIPPLLYIWVFSPLLILIPVLIGEKMKWALNGVKYLLSAILGPAIVLAAMVLLSQSHFNKQEHDIYEMMKCSFDGEWEKLIRLGQEQERINRLVQFELNHALYHQGVLLDNIFDFPQQFGIQSLYLDDSNNSHLAEHMASFYTDMAYTMEARHWATEALMALERRPDVLKPLVLSYLAMDNEQMAWKYLEILSRSRLHREWYEKVSTSMEQGRVDEIEEVVRFRENNPRVDYFASTSSPDLKMLAFYSNNPKNRMAFEYLVATYLLQHRVGLVVLNIKGFRDMGYEKLPRTVEEALMIQFAKSPNVTPRSYGYDVSPETVTDFKDFSELVATASGREAKMKAAEKYKNTYWYYVLFTSPYVQKQ